MWFNGIFARGFTKSQNNIEKIYNFAMEKCM